MRKLPEDEILRRHVFQDGLSDKEIAGIYGCSPQAVNMRLKKIGIERMPYSNTAAAILDAAWPRADYDRVKFHRNNPSRDLTVFMRWRLGDDSLTERQRDRIQRFVGRLERDGTVLALVWGEENPWVYVAREPSDGRRVVRWPQGRELPRGPHLEAITLPDGQQQAS
ncbi:hypothetical protein ACIQUL_36300 [Streptomyces sp. NPDC090303]|uniref:hypothetical protein n=1 Tax=Streptomyces sp. NPDC090303 TaxID=3365960 RepID=UPI0037F56A07